MQNLINKIKQHKVVCAISLSLVISFLSLIMIGICSEIPEIKTISFFILIELLVLFIIWCIVQLFYKFKSVQIYLYSSFSNFILGLHLVAGMLVLGVYYTL